jgi:secreted repeat protein with Y-X4-D motif
VRLGLQGVPEPPLASHGTSRVDKGGQGSLLELGRSRHGTRQVTYAGHPLCTFVGDKRAGQTTGEGLRNFGAEWYAVAANGHEVEKSKSASGSSARATGTTAPAAAGNGSAAMKMTPAQPRLRHVLAVPSSGMRRHPPRKRRVVSAPVTPGRSHAPRRVAAPSSTSGTASHNDAPPTAIHATTASRVREPR